MTSERGLDELLVKRVQSGEREAFDKLVAKYQRRIIRVVTQIVRDPIDAEDISQETFIKAFLAIRNFRNESSFYTWLYRIGVNSATNFVIRKNRRIAAISKIYRNDCDSNCCPESLGDKETPESVLASKQIAYTINVVMDGLSWEVQMTMDLYEIEGLSYNEISELMGCPSGTVRSRIFRAREVIAGKLRPLFDAPTRSRW